MFLLAGVSSPDFMLLTVKGVGEGEPEGPDIEDYANLNGDK